MKDKFLSKAYGGVTEARRKLYGLGLPRQWKVITSTLLLLFTFSIGNVWADPQSVTFGTSVGSKGYVYSSSTVADNSILSDRCVYYSSAKNTVSLANSKIIAYRLSLIFELSSSAKVDAVIGNNKNKPVTYVLYSIPATQYNFIKSMSGVANNVATAYVALDAEHPMKTLFKDASISDNDGSRQKLLSAVDVSGVTTKLFTSDSYTTSTSAVTTIPIYRAATGENKDVLSAGYYAIYIDCGSSSGNTLDNLTFTAVASCTAPTNPAIAGAAAYTEGENISLTASADGATSATYTWYKGEDWATASAGSSIGSAATLTINSCATSDAGTYWCNISNGTGCEVQVSKAIIVAAAGAVESNIIYTETKGATNTNPATYYEGTGVASFDPLEDVTDFHFTGWSPASIADDATGEQTIEAQWVDAYNVSFSAGAGSGTVPTTFQKWNGATFNLPGQGSMVAPSGKAFDGWKVSGTKYAANAEYTMGNAAVEFVAQWKNAPTVLFHYNMGNIDAAPADNTENSATGGKILFRNAKMGKESSSFNAAVKGDMIGGANSLKLGGNADSIRINLTTGNFQEGDTIYITGYNPFVISTTIARNGDVATSVATGTAKTDYNLGYCVIPAGFDTKYLYIGRESSSCGFAAIKVIRPAAREIASTVITLSDVMVNDASISAANLATLVADHSLALSDEFAAAPVIKFNEHTVITYDDELLPATKVTDKVYTVTATVNGDGKWQASQTINSVAYTVTAEKVSSAKVYYYDGAQKLGEEVVAINGSPVNAGDYDDKTLATFVGWYNNSDLAEEHKIANIAALVVTKDTTVYGKWNPVYATSINIEQWTLTNGAGIGATTKTSALISAIGSHNFAHNLEWVNKNLELDSLNDDPSKTNRNYAYLGLKVKVGGKMVDFRLQNGQTVKVKFGATGNYPQVALNGGSYGAMSLTDNVWTYTADGADAYISIKTPNTNTVVIKQIMINEDIAAVTLPWRVTYDANGGTCGTASAIWSGAALILPDVTPADADHTFAGWYDGETLAGAAGASYNAEANVTLQAHFAPVEYAIAYDGNGATSGSMVAGAAGWGTLVTPATNAFEKTGHIFSGWVITKTSDGSATGITFSEGKFEMPKYDVTLVAQWDDVSKVVKIVETDAKYETFAAAIAAVGADQTIQLLQSCEYSTYWDLDGSALTGTKTVTLDLNGKNLTYTGTKRGVQVSNGATLVLMDGTATVAPTIDLTTSPMARTAISYTSGTFDSKDGMCALAGSEIIINSGRYLATEGVILVKGPAATATVNDGVLICRDNSVVSGNGTNSADYRNYVMNIHGGILYGEIFSAGYASMVVYHPNVGELNIDGGILVSTNGPCVVTRGGETNITGGTLVALGSGSGKCGDASLVLPAVGIAVDFKSAYPGVASTDVAVSGTVDVTGQAGAVEAVYAAATPTATEESKVNISGGTFNTELTNDLCAPGYVPSAEVAPGVYTVVPKDGICIIKSTPTSGTEADVDGIYQGSAYFKGNAMKLKNEYDYVGVELAAGYTFQAGDKVVLNQTAAVSGTDITKFYIFTEVPAGGKTYVTVDNAAPVQGDNWFEMPAELVGRSALYIGRINNAFCNPTVGYLAVYRPLPPVLNKVTVNGVEGKPNALKEVVIEVAASTSQSELEAIAYDWVSNSDAWTAEPANAPVAANAWEFGVANTVTFTDKDGDASVYTITVNKAIPSSDATLSTLSYGTPATAIALADGVYEYDVLLPYGTSDVPALDATAHHIGATIEAIADATAFVDRKATSTVTVKAEDDATTQVYTVNFTVDRFESKVLWDGSTMSALSDITAAAAAAGVTITSADISVTSFSAKTCEENGKSYTKALNIGGNTKSTRYFAIEIPAGKVAKVSLVYKANGNSARSIIIGTALASVVDESAITSVEKENDQLLHVMTAEMFGGGALYINTTNGFQVHEISLQLAAGYGRSAMLGAGVLGTVCVPNNVTIEDIQGVTVYELMGRESQYGKLAFDEIISGELEAGVPYVFQAHRNHMALLYGETHVANPVDKGNGMYGTFTDQVLTDLNDVYYFAQKALWGCADLTSLSVPANRAYVKLSEVGSADPNPAPGRRRISMAVNGEQIATGIENTGFESEAPRKVLINGELYIIRGEKMYDAKGQLVK